MTDVLLEWLSFRGTGRVNDIPPDLIGQASAQRIVEDLVLLGHVELVERQSWRIAPPVLAGLPANGQPSNAILCGARTAGLLSRLRTVCERHGAGTKVLVSPNADRPTLIRVSAPTWSALAATAVEAGVAFQRNSAFTLLACAPAVKDWPRTPCAMVSGRVDTVRRFSRSKIHWVASTLVEARESKAGFFRIQRDWDWVSILKMGHAESAYIDHRAGRLIVAAKLKVATWDSELGTFSLPSQLFPPSVIARALTLCSGTPPTFDHASRRICFASVPFEVVTLALAITGLRLA